MICDECQLEMLPGELEGRRTLECQRCELTVFLTSDGEVCGSMAPIEDEIQAQVDAIFADRHDLLAVVTGVMVLLAVAGLVLWPIFGFFIRE